MRYFTLKFRVVYVLLRDFAERKAQEGLLFNVLVEVIKKIYIKPTIKKKGLFLYRPGFEFGTLA